MKRGAFKVGALESDAIHAVIVNFPSINIPKRKYTLNDSSMKLDRSLLFDDESYENRKISLTVGFKEAAVSVNERIAQLMAAFDTGHYVDFIVYSDPEYIYQVIRANDSTVVREAPNSDYRVVNLELSAAPYKYLADVADVSLGTTETIVSNPTLFEAKPYIKITGSGDITLTVNHEVFNFKGVTGSLELDSSMQTVWRMDGNTAVNENKKMVIGPFPVLKPGQNKIHLSAGIAKMTPRWRTL